MRNRQQLGLRYAIGSDTGIARQVNQDSVFASPRLLAVADGMGGHAHGEVASTVTIGILAELDGHLRRTSAAAGADATADAGADPAVDPLPVLAATVARVQRTLTEQAVADPELAGMGSTLTALLWDGATFGIAHVGDSRAYLLRDDTLNQLTRDHTLVQALVDDGQISAAEAETHPRRSTLLRALQTGGAAEPDLSTHQAAAGDRYLLCSDGVTCVVGPDILHDAMTTLADPADVVDRLINEAKRLLSPDNISCVVADVVTSAPSRDVLIGGAATAGQDRSGRLTRWARRLISR